MQAKRSKIAAQPGDSGSAGDAADESTSGGVTVPSLPLPSIEPGFDLPVPSLPVEPLPDTVEPLLETVEPLLDRSSRLPCRPHRRFPLP